MTSRRRQGAIFAAARGQEPLYTFEEAFPTIETASIEISETGEGNRGLGIRRFSRNSIREFVNCSNHRCEGKGLSLAHLLREMAGRRQTHQTIAQTCQSRDESGHPCPNRFDIEIHLTYKK